MTDSTDTPGVSGTAAMAVDFVPPPPDQIPSEPATGGATDRDLGGTLVTDPDAIAAAAEAFAAAVADFVAAAAIPGAPTWSQVYKLAHSQIAKWAPGRRGENVNDYTIWFYGTASVSAAFCFIFICWCLCHAISRKPTAAMQTAALSLLGGQKLAYVPYIRNVPGYVPGHSGMRVGAIVAVGSFQHIGFCVRVGSTTFDLLSGNSVNGDSDDAITIKTYSLIAAAGHVNLPYPKTATTTSVEETLKTLVDLGAEAKPQTVKAGQRLSLTFEKEYSGGDPEKIHKDADKDGAYPSWLPTGDDAPYAVTAEVILAGRPDPGVFLTVASYTRDKNDLERDIRAVELVGSREVMTGNVRMSKAHKYRVDVHNTSGRDVVVQKAYLLVAH